jgi:tRNA G18 (ribose-2'-O)-methylase SpoU
MATEQITIKMTGLAESLNAATAAAISIWEMMK